LAVVNKLKFYLLGSKFQKHLLHTFFCPGILFAPKQVNVVWHDDEPVQPNLFVLGQKFKAAHDDFLPYIGLDQGMPIEASGCKKIQCRLPLQKDGKI
jgi:hypothetical protein